MSNESSISVPDQDSVGPELGAKPIAANAARETVRNSLEHLQEKRAGRKPEEERDAPSSEKKEKDDELEEGLEESFPASDTPASVNPIR